MALVQRFDHVGISVVDIDRATAFFVGLGLEVEGRTFVEGALVDSVVGVPGCRCEIVMLRLPGGGTGLELSAFVRPGNVPGTTAATPDQPGIRNIAFLIDDVDAAVAHVAAEGYDLVGGIGRHEDIWRMVYVRGPEGILIALIQRVG